MQPLHEQFLAAVAEERTRLRSRRALLAGGAKLAGGGTLALLAAGAPGFAGARLAKAQEFVDDIDILNYALTLELLEATFYAEGLEQFDEAAFEEAFGEASDEDATPAASGGTVRARFEEIAEHEQEHVDFLTTTITDLGFAPVEGGEFDFGDAFESIEAFFETAQAFENTGVSAYLGAAPAITDPTVLGAAGTIVTVEARHAAYLNQLNGDSPFPDSFDEPLTRDEVLDAVAPFVVTLPAADDAAGAGAATVPAAAATVPATTTAVADTDDDGLADVDEATAGSDPTVADTDGDGVGDGDEFIAGTDPTDPADGAATGAAVDTDGDGLADADEATAGTDATVADTDGDGVGDGDEVAAGTDPTDPASS